MQEYKKSARNNKDCTRQIYVFLHILLDIIFLMNELIGKSPYRSILNNNI